MSDAQANESGTTESGFGESGASREGNVLAAAELARYVEEFDLALPEPEIFDLGQQ